jgi:hypothetical protein
MSGKNIAERARTLSRGCFDLPMGIAIGSALLHIISAEPALAASDLRALFNSPPETARPWLRWWWPGGAVSDEQLRSETAVMQAAGFGGAEIQPFNPGIPNLTEVELHAVDNYATPAFFSHVAAAAEAARKLGFRIDMTFGSGWPSGGGQAVTPELALLELTMARTEVTGPAAAPVKVTIPGRTPKFGTLAESVPGMARMPSDWRDRIAGLGKTVAVVAMRGTAPQLNPAAPGAVLNFNPFGTVATPGSVDPATAVILTDRLKSDVTLDWAPPPGRWQVFVFREYVSDGVVLGGVGGGPQLVLDHFNRAAFDAHAGRIGDAGLPQLGKYVGNAYRASFIDSLELFPDIYWSRDMLAQFRKRRGYDLTPYLPLIVTPGWMTGYAGESQPLFAMGDLGDRIRADYRRTVSELMLENFYQPWVDWTHRNGLLARLQVHGAPVDWIKGYGLADIPETEDLGGATRDFRIIARSAADIYGHSNVSSESFVWSGKPFSVTPAMWKRRADLLFASGVNEIVGHGFTYGLHTETWPGWYAFAPSAFTQGFSSMLSPPDPLWPVVPALTGYISRIQAVLQATRNVVPVAVYLQDLAYRGTDKGLDRALYADGYDYDRINSDGLFKGRVEAGQLVTPGRTRFAALVLPNVAALPAETAERLAELAAQGLPIFFTDALPDRDEGFFDKDRRDARVRTAVAAVLKAGPEVIPLQDLPIAMRKAKIPANLTFLNGEGAPFIEKADGDRRLYFFYNDQDLPKPVAFTTSAHGGAELWDGWTGETLPQPVMTAADGTRVALTLAPNSSALVVFDPEKPRFADSAPVHAMQRLREKTIEGSWSFHAQGHGAKGRVIAMDAVLPTLRDWSEIPGATDLAGIGSYAHHVAIEAGWLAEGGKIDLDLGAVHDAAIASVNGVRFPALLFPPFIVDVTRALHPGDNDVEVEVVNAPQNAMVDPAASAPMRLQPIPAGLLGPVKLESTVPGLR